MPRLISWLDADETELDEGVPALDAGEGLFNSSNRHVDVCFFHPFCLISYWFLWLYPRGETLHDECKHSFIFVFLYFYLDLPTYSFYVSFFYCASLFFYPFVQFDLLIVHLFTFIHLRFIHILIHSPNSLAYLFTTCIDLHND